MNLNEINQHLESQARLLESEGGPALPKIFTDNLEKTIKGIFNDVSDETGYRSWEFVVVGSKDGARGQVSFGWTTEKGVNRVKNQGVRLVAYGNPNVISIRLVSASSKKNINTPPDQMGRVPTFGFPTDGSDYAMRLRALVDRVRKLIKRK